MRRVRLCAALQFCVRGEVDILQRRRAQREPLDAGRRAGQLDNRLPCRRQSYAESALGSHAVCRSAEPRSALTRRSAPDPSISATSSPTVARRAAGMSFATTRPR